MSELDKRKLAKYAAKTIVMGAASKAITKVLLAAIPQLNDTVADILGAVGGYVTSEKLEPQTDQLVDNAFDHFEAKKTVTA